jgi:FkbM family methyltransferase
MTTTKVVNGFVWPASDTDCAAVVFERLADLDAALTHVRAFDVAVQAGGNCGVWPKRLGEWFGLVYTFEPHPENFACLAINCHEFHIVSRQAALGNRRERVGLAYESGPQNLGAVYVDGPGDIRMERLDDFALARCDFLQLDIEGYELEALKGAAETIARCRPVLMLERKLWMWPDRYPWTDADVDAWVAQRGYRQAATLNRDVVWVPGDGDECVL